MISKKSKLEYFEILQKEALFCIIRAITYPEKHCDFWKTMVQRKKEKIENIQSYYPVRSIFNSEEACKQYIEKLVPHFGLPDFFYNDKDNEHRQRFFDALNYFRESTYYLTKKGRVLVNVSGVNIKSKTAVISYDTIRKTVPFSLLQRDIETEILQYLKNNC